MLPDWVPQRVKDRITVEDRGFHLGPCWIVGGWDDGKGHKKIRWGGVCTFVHRVVFSLRHKRDVKTLLAIDHLCRQEACCNPDHLEDVTMRVNTDRGLGALHQFKPASHYHPPAGDWRERYGDPLDQAYG
jgi:hypothetical protein